MRLVWEGLLSPSGGVQKQRIEYMMAMMHQQQELQQQQHQQFQAVMTQQSELMKALILKSNGNKNSF